MTAVVATSSMFEQSFKVLWCMPGALFLCPLDYIMLDRCNKGLRACGLRKRAVQVLRQHLESQAKRFNVSPALFKVMYRHGILLSGSSLLSGLWSESYDGADFDFYRRDIGKGTRRNGDHLRPFMSSTKWLQTASQQDLHAMQALIIDLQENAGLECECFPDYAGSVSKLYLSCVVSGSLQKTKVCDVINTSRLKTIREFIETRFDFAFLKNTWDGKTLYVSHLDAVLERYDHSVQDDYGNLSDQLQSLRDFYFFLRQGSCKKSYQTEQACAAVAEELDKRRAIRINKYVDRGFTFPPFRWIKVSPRHIYAFIARSTGARKEPLW